MNCTFRGITFDWSDEQENASDSNRVNLELDSNVINEIDSHQEKHDEPRMLNEQRIVRFDKLEKLWINLCDCLSIKNSFITSKIVFSASIEIESTITPAIADPSMNCTFRGITIDWSDEDENAFDSIRVNLESDSNVIVESDQQFEKHHEQIISTFRGITIDWSNENENASDSIRTNFESDSNVINESNLQPEKHDEQRISIFCGITIDWSDE
jgi:hypothetical protein